MALQKTPATLPWTMTSPSPPPSPYGASSSADDAPAAKRHKVDHEADNDERESASPDLGSEFEEPSAEPGETEPSAADAANGASSVASTSATSTRAPGAPIAPVGVATASAGDWQAVWSPAHNAYYFYNAKTQETTWTNPLQPESSSSASPSAPESSSSDAQASTSTSGATSSLYALQAAAAEQGIDPSLAYLDPSLVAGTSSAPQAFTYTAKFNARTGAFTRPDGRDPTHVSEYERARRMSEAYFDVGQWEKDVEERKAEEEAESRKKKKPTKKDLVRLLSCLGYNPCGPHFALWSAGEIQGAKAAQEDRKDSVAPYIDETHYVPVLITTRDFSYICRKTDFQMTLRSSVAAYSQQ